MITWNTDVDAPCCLGEILNDDGRSVLVQTDWDYPGTASTFGWSSQDVQQCKTCGHIHNGLDGEKRPLCAECSESFPVCDHDGTDGTVCCGKCGLSALDFINAAGEFLADAGGAMVDDPGYFDNGE